MWVVTRTRMWTHNSEDFVVALALVAVLVLDRGNRR